MATPMFSCTSERRNANLASEVLLGPCTKQLRDVLRHRIPPVRFPHIIKQNRRNLPRLTQPQIDLIFPRCGDYNGVYDDMDISLLYILLRNICNIQPHTHGWGNRPDPNDLSLSANIERIRDARNRVGHISDPNLSQSDLSDIWTTVRTSVVQMDTYLKNGNKYEKEIETLATEYRDEEPDVNGLKNRVVELNDLETREIPLDPLRKSGDKLRIEQVFASVVIMENYNVSSKGKKSARKRQKQKELKIPEDMLTKNGKPVRRVFMLGDAAHGKTAYCMWLLKNWCNAQQNDVSGMQLNEWENALGEFDFVFFLPLRYVDPSRANVTDMICQDILGTDSDLETAAKHVLSSGQYRCFIMIDGLDEWNPNQSAIDQLRYKGMPNIENMSNCVIFTTMRSWMYASVAGLVRDDDRVIEIKGLDDKGIEDVITKVLINHFEMEPESEAYNTKHKEIMKRMKDETLRSFIKIPLLAVVCVQLWYIGEQVEGSMTSFYTAMVDMLIARAKVKDKIPTEENTEIRYSLPQTLSDKINIQRFNSILLKLGKVAYEGLLGSNRRLEFSIEQLQNEIGVNELQLALDVGLISQTEAPSVVTRMTYVHFFHKSIQEFLAAIYIVTQREVHDKWKKGKHLSNVNVSIELSNIIMFICGMCPSLGSDISKRIVSVTDTDAEVSQYRESSPWLDNNAAEHLFKLQVSWYNEFQHGKINDLVKFHVSDVCLWNNDDITTIQAVRGILSDSHDGIRSLHLWDVPADGVHCVTNKDLNDFLTSIDKTKSLVKLCIKSIDTDRSVSPMCIPNLRYLVLFNVTIQDVNIRDNVYRPLLTDMSLIQWLELVNVSLGDRDIGLTSDMVKLRMVVLEEVTMTSACWESFMQSLTAVHHNFTVRLIKTDVDSQSLIFIRTSPHIFTIVRDEHTVDGNHKLFFTRDWKQHRQCPLLCFH